MTREKMLEILSDLPFAMIWPGSWDDIGFTEREIWVNNQGYGYIMCDEPTGRWDGPGLTETEWASIQTKLEDENISYTDIIGTSIADLLSSFGYEEGDLDEDEEYLFDLLKGLLTLERGPCGHLYAIQTDDGPMFFDSEEAFNKAYERDWADESWDDMSDDLLAEWIDRLSIEDDIALVHWSQKHNLPEEEADDGSLDVRETGEYKGYWTAYNSKAFTFCCSTVVYEGKKKRYVSLIATGENRSTNNTTSKSMTVFQVISTRNETICRFVISGDIENSEPLSSDEELGKWAIVKNHMYPRLIDSIMRVVGKDFQARSLDLYYSIKKALDTTVLDQLIESAENDRI